jgi:hypothetical protein
MILMCPCIIEFIGGMDYEGEWITSEWLTRPSNPFPPMKYIIHRAIRINGQ